MILKKPYAFLIKHFRLIHIILAVPLIYISRQTRQVSNFFNDYVSNSYSFQTGSDISSLYVSGLMLFSVFIIIIAALAIYFLLKYKEKPVKMYVFTVIYYIVLFMALFWLSGIISSMSREVLTAKAARMYRDISLIIYLPQYIFIVFVLLRAVGFNIKQMNFKDDLRELEITSADNEEVEVGIEIDGYKAKRFFRRFKREFSYYLLENKFMITVVVILFIFSSILIYYKTRENYNNIYKQKDSFYHQGFKVNIKDSIITNLSQNGEVLNNKHYYLVLKTNAINTMKKKAKLDYGNFIISVGNKEISPILDRSTYFSDYGEPYYGDYIKTDIDKDYALVYQIDKEDLNKSFKLKLLSSFEVRKNKLITKYAIVDLSPVIIDEVVDIKTANIKDKVIFNNSNIGSTILQINSFYKGSSYQYDYEYCYSEGNCETKKDIVTVDYRKTSSEASLIVLDYDFDLDPDSTYAKYVKNNLNFFSDFVKIKSSAGYEPQYYSVTNVTPKNLKDKIVLQVSGNILGSSDIDMIITIRNKRYTINLV